MGVKERREREKAEMRSRIMEAATELFVEEGIPSVSIRKIADKIEYSPATIYLYFRDKEHLLASVCEETFIHLREGLQKIMATDEDPVVNLRRGLRCYINFGLEHPHHYVLTFGTPHQHDPAVSDSGLETFGLLRTALERCREAGVVKFADLEATSQSVWMFIHGTASLLILFNKDEHFPWVERERLIENSLDLIIRGLKA